LMADAALAVIVAVECLCVLAIAGIFDAHAGGRLALLTAAPRDEELPRRSDSFIRKRRSNHDNLDKIFLVFLLRSRLLPGGRECLL